MSPPTGLGFTLKHTHTYGFAFARLSVGLTCFCASGARAVACEKFR